MLTITSRNRGHRKEGEKKRQTVCPRGVPFFTSQSFNTPRDAVGECTGDHFGEELGR
jgi:hypothetical protein